VTLKRLLTAGFALGLLALTGLQVGDLWSRQSPLPEVDLAPPANPASSATPVAAPVSEYRDHLVGKPDRVAALDRLETRLQFNPEDLEARLLRGLVLFQLGDLPAAIDELRNLTERAPKFRLAHLVLGDLLLARFDQLSAFGAGVESVAGFSASERLRQLQSEARARLQGYLSLQSEDQVPRALMSLGRNTDYALLVDKSRNRLYVYRNQGAGLPPRLVEDFYIVLGRVPGDKQKEGDLRTPSGVYQITSYLKDEQLPPLYGDGAYPVNYPNEYDRRLEKTGNGIWLHGTEKKLYSRPPLDSEGCVVLTNAEFARIKPYVTTGRTPVVISEELAWISSREWLDQNIELQAALENWRQSWEAADLEAYLQNYATDFWTRKHDFDSWAAYKKRVFAGKTFQQIDLSDISLLKYPRVDDQRPMVVANFYQRYRSNNYNGDMRKRIYLIKQESGWRVMYEGKQ
jgi:murein L,D-transpeptidase YafK